MSDTALRLSSLIGPLRRAMLRNSRNTPDLPDLPDAQVEILRALAANPAQSPTTLARNLAIARSTASNLLKTMTEQGLITKSLDDSDGRSTIVVPTSVATTLLGRYDETSARMLDEALAQLPGDDAQRIRHALPALERLRAKLEGR